MDSSVDFSVVILQLLHRIDLEQSREARAILLLEAVWRSVLCGVVKLAKGEKKKTHPVLSSKVTKNKQVDSVGSVRKVTTLRLRVAFIAALCSGKAHISVKADEVVENSEEFKY